MFKKVIETGLKTSSPNEYYLICQKCNKPNYRENCFKYILNSNKNGVLDTIIYLIYDTYYCLINISTILVYSISYSYLSRILHTLNSNGIFNY